MPLISKSSIQELNDRLDAIRAVSDYVQLEKKGSRWWGCCPFHQEKTPSFTVNPDQKSFYCFGCQKHGSVINFVMEMDKLSYPEALELLAKRFGVELIYERSGDGAYSAEDEERKKGKEELFELYKRISGTFHHFLLKKREFQAAKQYIITRGISIEMLERFRLGFAPADRYWLHTFLSGKGYSERFLASSGLFSSKYPKIAFFSGRLMFPIADRQGRVVAFGGRFLPGLTPQRDDQEPPKYINSQELPIYKKRETLFAADLAIPEIRRTKTAYIAEGYMDVIALHQAGISNALAPLGTAFTDEQAKLLRRWAEKVILFFDTDRAGQDAALKAIYTCRRNGLACALIRPGKEKSGKNGGENPPLSANAADNLNQGNSGPDSADVKDPADIQDPTDFKDPADILRYSGPEALQKKAKSFINDFDYLINRAGALYDISGSVQGKAQAVAFLFPYIDLLDSEVARDSGIETAADAFGLLPALVADDYRRYLLNRESPESAAGARASREEEVSRQSGGRTLSPIRMNDELSLLIAVAADYVSSQKEGLYPKFRAVLEISEIDDVNAKELFVALEECSRYGETGMDEFLTRISSPELKKIFMERSASGEFSVNPRQFVDDGIQKIRRKRLERRNNEILVELRGLKKNVPGGEYSPEAKELLSEKMQIDHELYQLKQRKTTND